MLTGDNGILNQAKRAKELTEITSEEEYIKLLITEEELTKEKIGKELKEVKFNTLEDTTSIYDSETGTTYANGWYYLRPEDVTDYNLKNSYIIDYETREFIKYNEEKHKIVTNELLCIKEGLVYSADPKNITDSNSWGDAILHNFKEGEENSGWTENSLMFDGIDDGLEVKDNSDYSNGITLEIYFKLKGQTKAQQCQILIMKRTNSYNGFFIRIGNGQDLLYPYKILSINVGGIVEDIQPIYIDENVATYITYTYNPNEEEGILYIDGMESFTTKKGNIDNLINIQENTPIQIGSDIYKTDSTGGKDSRYPFYGEIYASRVYNRPLTESEVKYNYEMTVNNSK